MAQLADLQPSVVEEMIKENIVMIDIRRPEEFAATGVIKNAHKMTFFDMYGNYDIDKWMGEFQKLVTTKDQPIILICAHANRTRTVGNFLIEQGYVNTAHLAGGMAAWLNEGKEVVK